MPQEPPSSSNMQPQEQEPQFELNQGLSSRVARPSLSQPSIPSGHLPRAFLSRCDAFLPRRVSPPSSPPHAFLSRCDAFLAISPSPPSSPPHASIPSGHAFFVPQFYAFLSSRLSLPSSPHGSLSGSLSPPSSPPHGSLSGYLSPPSLSPHAPIPSGDELLPPSSSSIAFDSSKSRLFSYKELDQATGGFAILLGQGGFGSVHKGTLPDGKEIAVKQLKPGSRQGDSEFQAEVKNISRVHHRHLVSLVGYCSTGSQRLLAYEFVPNNTLKFHLHGIGQPTMDWSTRLKIALGSAKGLAYLHEYCHPNIIHRDIKADNILLDSRFEAKIADFGLAKTISDLETHVSTHVKGSFGYMDPYYYISGKLTDKTDVYSYGVVLLELLTGRLPVDKAGTYHVSLVEWARPILMEAVKGKNSKHFITLVDPRLGRNGFDRDEMTRMVACAEACTRQSAKDRPNMSQVVRDLEGPGRVYSRDYNSQQENMTKLKKIASDIKGKWKWK